jgi:3-oxoisoapionate kinase
LPPIYIFYGDDFTGSTDSLEQLAANGVPSALFLAPPTPGQLRQFPSIQAFGVAGDSRSRSPDWMSEHVPPLFNSLRDFRAPIVHYKVCSTFDSSPLHGSIGRAIELGIEAFAPRFVPILVGAPHLRRFVFEGRLFASAPDGIIHRIDRHPMSRHPVTPMREPDLRLHLQEQTSLPIALIPHTQLQDPSTAAHALQQQLASGCRPVLFDTIDTQSLNLAGELIWQSALEAPLFSASSSGLTTALISAWRSRHLTSATPSPTPMRPVEPLLVVSGSCSVITSQQIRWASSHGFHTLDADPALLLQPHSGRSYQEALVRNASTSLNGGRDSVIYTALDSSPTTPTGEALGSALGELLREILAQTSVTRVVLCGGDTSSHAVQQLGISALTWAASLQPGAPLCRAHFPNPTTRSLELVLKGGQVGSKDFFAIARGASEA